MKNERYDLLDGLRGVAAMLVLLYHIFNDAKSFFVWATPVNEFFHSFLGVDFFFILSGFACSIPTLWGCSWLVCSENAVLKPLKAMCS